MTLPLEQAVREACAEKNIPFDRTERRTVLHITNEFMASYSTKRFPPEETCPEVLRLVRTVRTGLMELYIRIRLDDTVQIGLLEKNIPKSPTWTGDQEANQLLEVYRHAKDDLKIKEKYDAKQPNPHMLKDLARDFLTLLTYAKRIIKPINEKLN